MTPLLCRPGRGRGGDHHAGAPRSVRRDRRRPSEPPTTVGATVPASPGCWRRGRGEQRDGRPPPRSVPAVRVRTPPRRPLRATWQRRRPPAHRSPRPATAPATAAPATTAPATTAAARLAPPATSGDAPATAAEMAGSVRMAPDMPPMGGVDTELDAVPDSAPDTVPARGRHLPHHRQRRRRGARPVAPAFPLVTPSARRSGHHHARGLHLLQPRLDERHAAVGVGRRRAGDRPRRALRRRVAARRRRLLGDVRADASRARRRCR